MHHQPRVGRVVDDDSMVQDRLTKQVLRRLKELGLPPSLIDLGNFHDNFFFHRWVMFVRDRDNAADVHLIQPRKTLKPRRRR